MRTIKTFGDPKLRIKTNKPAHNREPLTDAEKTTRRLAVRELTQNSPETIAKRELLKLEPLQRLITAAIEQGFFDRVKLLQDRRN